jgi:hypothetical protein
MHVVPPCNISESEFNEGVAILDKAFTAISKHYSPNQSNSQLSSGGKL